VPSARIGDIDIHHQIAGEGPRLLYIGGTGGDLRVSPNIFDGPLVRHFSVAAYDQRGLGQSSKPDRLATMAEYAGDAAGLLEHLGWAGAVVVGVSFGGMVAQELAITRPDLVERLVLCCTSSGGAGGASYPLHRLADLAPDERRRTRLAISDTRHDDTWQRTEPEEAAKLLAQMAAAEAKPGSGDPEAAIGARRQLEARIGHDTWDRLSEITAPTLVAAGRYDGIAPVANSEAMVSRLANAELQTFEGGHLFLRQDRSAWPAILAFLLDQA